MPSGMTPPKVDLTSPRGQVMLTYLPAWLAASQIYAAIFQAQGSEIDALREACTEILNQAYVTTATWGLETWESELALPPPANISPPFGDAVARGLGQQDPTPVDSLTDDQRRSRILGQLRGFGTATCDVVRNVAQSYEGGQIDVVEDFPNYTVYIKFTSQANVPSNITDLQNTLRALIPAHLDVQYVYNFLTWDRLDQHNYTWDQVDALNDSWDVFEQIQ